MRVAGVEERYVGCVLWWVMGGRVCSVRLARGGSMWDWAVDLLMALEIFQDWLG